MKPSVTFITVLVWCFVAGNAKAGLFEDNEARQAILELREQHAKDQAFMNTISEQLDRLGKNLLNTNLQLEVLRNEIAGLRGQSEVLLKHQTDVQQKQSALQTGVDERLRKLEPISISVDGKTFKAAPEEAAWFNQALALMKKSDFSGALINLDNLLIQYPKTGYLESAAYWQGNAHYGLGACKPAMVAFRKVLALNPTHTRAAEAMLSIANCHSELNENKQARELLQTLLTIYPDSEAAQVARERLSSMAPAKIAPAKAPPRKRK